MRFRRQRTIRNSNDPRVPGAQRIVQVVKAFFTDLTRRPSLEDDFGSRENGIDSPDLYHHLIIPPRSSSLNKTTAGHKSHVTAKDCSMAIGLLEQIQEQKSTHNVSRKRTIKSLSESKATGSVISQPPASDAYFDRPIRVKKSPTDPSTAISIYEDFQNDSVPVHHSYLGNDSALESQEHKQKRRPLISRSPNVGADNLAAFAVTRHAVEQSQAQKLRKYSPEYLAIQAAAQLEKSPTTPNLIRQDPTRTVEASFKFRNSATDSISSHQTLSSHANSTGTVLRHRLPEHNDTEETQDKTAAGGSETSSTLDDSRLWHATVQPCESSKSQRRTRLQSLPDAILLHILQHARESLGFAQFRRLLYVDKRFERLCRPLLVKEILVRSRNWCKGALAMMAAGRVPLIYGHTQRSEPFLKAAVVTKVMTLLIDWRDYTIVNPYIAEAMADIHRAKFPTNSLITLMTTYQTIEKHLLRGPPQFQASNEASSSVKLANDTDLSASIRCLSCCQSFDLVEYESCVCSAVYKLQQPKFGVTSSDPVRKVAFANSVVQQ